MGKKRITLIKEFKEILQRGNFEELKEVFIKCDINAKTDRYGSNALSLYPLTKEFAFWLKEQGIDLEFRNDRGETPLLCHTSAFRLGGDPMLLIELGCDINAIDKYGENLLHKAISVRNIEMINYLIANGFDVNFSISDYYSKDKTYSHLELLLSHNLNAIAPLQILETCEILIKNGATITEKSQYYISKIGEEFEFRRDGFNPDIIDKNESNLNKLYKLFSVKPASKRMIHDGVSDIVIEIDTFANMYNKLWDFLVPSSGKAKTAQAEAIRLAGRISYEIMDNGGINWDKDFSRMSKALYEYLKYGNPLPEDKLKSAESITKIISGTSTEECPTTLSKYVVDWIIQNPKVLPPLKADYMR